MEDADSEQEHGLVINKLVTVTLRANCHDQAAIFHALPLSSQWLVITVSASSPAGPVEKRFLWQLPRAKLNLLGA